jgi:hypothetical protein
MTVPARSPLSALLYVFAGMTVLLILLFAVTGVLAARHRRWRRSRSGGSTGVSSGTQEDGSASQQSAVTIARAAIEDGYAGLVREFPDARIYTTGDLVMDPHLNQRVRDIARRIGGTRHPPGSAPTDPSAGTAR